jgi:hypothetical protein
MAVCGEERMVKFDPTLFTFSLSHHNRRAKKGVKRNKGLTVPKTTPSVKRERIIMLRIISK